MTELLDVTDRRNRIAQQALVGGGGLLFLVGQISSYAASQGRGALPPYVATGMMIIGPILFVVGLFVRQSWEIEYRGRRIRFTSGALTAERLSIDGVPVARGRMGRKVELRAPIGDEGVGEEILVLVDAGQLDFRVRMFACDAGTGAPEEGYLPGRALV